MMASGYALPAKAFAINAAIADWFIPGISGWLTGTLSSAFTAMSGPQQQPDEPYARRLWSLMLEWLFDPFIFNYLIIALYALNSFQFFVRGFFADGCYWASALAITLTVTYGYQR